MTLPQILGVFIICTAVLIFAELKRAEQKRREQSRTEYDAAELHEAIRALCSLSDQLDNADRMLADLNACSPRQLLRSFRAQWCGIDGHRRTIDFLADGRNGATFGLKQAAQDQREQINHEIIETIRALNIALDTGEAPAISLDVVGETVDETAAAADAGEW